MTQAVLEGVAHAFRDARDALASAGTRIDGRRRDRRRRALGPVVRRAGEHARHPAAPRRRRIARARARRRAAGAGGADRPQPSFPRPRAGRVFEPRPALVHRYDEAHARWSDALSAWCAGRPAPPSPAVDRSELRAMTATTASLRHRAARPLLLLRAAAALSRRGLRARAMTSRSPTAGTTRTALVLGKPHGGPAALRGLLLAQLRRHRHRPVRRRHLRAALARRRRCDAAGAAQGRRRLRAVPGARRAVLHLPRPRHRARGRARWPSRTTTCAASPTCFERKMAQHRRAGCCGARPTCSRTRATWPARRPIPTPRCSPTPPRRCATCSR